MEKELLKACDNCGCQRYTTCRCKLPNPKSQTQQKKLRRKNG
jgi:hypothetical protein